MEARFGLQNHAFPPLVNPTMYPHSHYENTLFLMLPNHLRGRRAVSSKNLRPHAKFGLRTVLRLLSLLKVAGHAFAHTYIHYIEGGLKCQMPYPLGVRFRMGVSLHRS